MVTQQDPVLTLRYGGVEFSLIPSGPGGGQAIFEQLEHVAHDGIDAGNRADGGTTTGGNDDHHHQQQQQQQQQQSPAGVLWRLVNFTGTLRVVDSAQTSEPAAAPANAGGAPRPAPVVAPPPPRQQQQQQQPPPPPPSLSSTLTSLSPYRDDESGTHAGIGRVPVVSSTKGERSGGSGGGSVPKGTKSAAAAKPTAKPQKQRQTSIAAFAVRAPEARAASDRRLRHCSRRLGMTRTTTTSRKRAASKHSLGRRRSVKTFRRTRSRANRRKK
jgi:hypothetical protein